MSIPNTGTLHTHTHWAQVFLVQRVANGWVYTTNITLGKDKSIPLHVFQAYWRPLGGTHD